MANTVLPISSESAKAYIDHAAIVINSEAQTMSSLQIAELTGKQHRHVMEAIRKMEPAWEKINGSKFRLVEYTDAKGEKRPCYQLTKTECPRNLRLNEASRLGMYQSIAEPYRLAIPQYVESKGVTKSAKDLLKEIGSTMSAIRFNTLLVEQGYLETKSRPSASGAIKKFKSITAKGEAYGQNLQSPRNQKETQPLWYDNMFSELVSIATRELA